MIAVRRSAFVTCAALAAFACISRPVVTEPPDLTTTFTNDIPAQGIDKIDLLFMIDNSVSMGDKQSLLAQAVPDMISRLVQPNCLDQTSNAVTGPSDASGGCPAGSKLEFPPVHDMHIGIVSSSLGGRGSPNQCVPGTPAGSHNDDRGELLNRAGDDEHTVDKAQPLHFLSWFPPSAANAASPDPPPANPETQVGASGEPGTLVGDFTDLISGVHEHGCGYEAQNEAWYRFLVQPDPFDSIAVSGSGVASLAGIDNVILAQRAAFLRPDSLLAVIVVTDENEEVANPLALGGEGWAYESYPFPRADPGGQTAPEGTIECQTKGPEDPACQSCGASSVKKDPNFAARCPADPPDGTGGYSSSVDDQNNTRFFHQKQRFGVFAGYPVSRYVRGLTRTTVPDRDHEVDGNGNYVGDQYQYADCVNPIFAQNLPTSAPADGSTKSLCALQHGPRTPDHVFYAAIAGVPHQLLQTDPTDPDSPPKETLSDADWRRITGADPEDYDFTGADFHMLESELPRAASTCPPGADDACDPLNGREWNTGQGDLEFACTFRLPAPKDCTLPQFAGACDCFDGVNVNPQGKPLCQKDDKGQYTAVQIFGKAYPSVREMVIAHAMGEQGIVSSLCPIHTSYAGGDPTDPLYGYRPAMQAIVDRLKTKLVAQCLPEKLRVRADGSVPCLLLVTMPCAQPGAGGACRDDEEGTCDHPERGLSVPASDVLGDFRRQKHDAWLESGGAASGDLDPATLPVCQLNQIDSGSAAYAACAGSETSQPPGWCYVSQPGLDCVQEILFTQDEPPPRSKVSLTCFEQGTSVVDGGDAVTLP